MIINNKIIKHRHKKKKTEAFIYQCFKFFSIEYGYSQYSLFFGNTYSETIVLLSQNRLDTHINLKLDLLELDVTAAGTKATYQEIKNYVFEKFGLEVSFLYILQVKTKGGIIEHENHNKGKEGHRVPQCPKENDIMDALRYFLDDLIL